MQLYPKLILDALSHVRYPGSGKNIVEAGMVNDDVRIEGNKVSFSLLFDRVNAPFIKSLVRAAETAVLTYVSTDVNIKGNVSAVVRQPSPAAAGSVKPPLSQVKNIVAIASGKGGVGKSTVAANLAIALANGGYSVGLLDADIFGPSQPKMFGVENARPCAEKTPDGRELIQPISQYGVKLLSIGFFVNKNDAVMWRGAMASNALKQLLTEADWGDLDFLLIDLPPGTSDIQITLVQTIAVTGTVIVSTPQEVALADARKAISMFTADKVKVPVLGLVENMAWFTPTELPDSKYYIFGKNGCAHLAKELNLPLLAQIPLVQSICDNGDDGTPVALNKDSLTGAYFRQLAHDLTDIVSLRNEKLAPTRPVERV